MKTVVFITGTNGVGKTTLAKELIKRYGGVARMEGRVTVCVDERITLAGKFAGVKYGGVDGLNETKCLAGMARTAFLRHEVFICEGSYMNTFGMNLTSAAFVGDRQLVVYLYAPVAEIDKRLKIRGGGYKGNDNKQTAPRDGKCQEMGGDRSPRPFLQHCGGPGRIHRRGRLCKD